MADLLLDVHLDFDPASLRLQRDPVRFIAEAMRSAAEAHADEQGATLRHPEPREAVTKTALSPTTGEDVLLVSTRWLADPR